MYRNFNEGWESCANGNCGSNTDKDFGVTPMEWPYDMRYGAVIGNVSGTPGLQTVYDSSSFGGCAGRRQICNQDQPLLYLAKLPHCQDLK